MTRDEQMQRLGEAHKEAWQMALDNNQHPDMRRAWETKRDILRWEMCLLLLSDPFPGNPKENVAAG